MRLNLPSALGSAVTTFIWVYIASIFNLPPWVAFLGWTMYFLTGANMNAIKVSAPALVFGAIMAYLNVTVSSWLPSFGYIIPTFIVSIMAFIISLAGSTELLKMVAVSFVGANIYFACGNLFISIILSLVGLGILGPLSDFFTAQFERLLAK